MTSSNTWPAIVEPSSRDSTQWTWSWRSSGGAPESASLGSVIRPFSDASSVRVERRQLGRGDRSDPGELGRPQTLTLRECLDLRHQLVATLEHQDVAASELGLGDQP